MAKAKCGCDIDWSGPLGEIAFCPKHAAVDDLIEALEAIHAQKCYCHSELLSGDCPHLIAQDAIRKAGG